MAAARPGSVPGLGQGAPPGLDHLGQADLSGGHHRDLHRQGLLDHDGHRVPVPVGRHHAGHGEQVGLLELGANPVRWQAALELDCVPQAKPLDELDQRLTERARRR